jgi:mono/diheme cytochrome c family protein
MIKKLCLIALIIFLAACVLVPGKRTNPPATNAVAWDSPRTQELFDRTCADCHSHATQWPWYSRLGPASWLVIHHVNEGRDHFNVSETPMGHAHDAAEMVREGEMPVAGYARMHPAARLTEAEKTELIAGLDRTFGLEHGD